MNDPITKFWDDYRFLSNFQLCDIEFEGHIYKSTEHAFQAAKTIIEEERTMIRDAVSPGKAKRLGAPPHKGGKITMRPGWDEMKYDVMYQLCLQKFEKHLELRKLLLATGDAPLLEGNNWSDRIWGCEMVGGQWKGMNKLGEILMRIRNELKAKQV